MEPITTPGGYVTKFCFRCGKTQNTDNFFKDKSRKDGFYSCCKNCVKIYSRTESGVTSHRNSCKKYIKTHPTQRKITVLNWRHNNPEYFKKYHIKNLEKRREDGRVRRIINKEKYKKVQLEYRRRNREVLNNKYLNRIHSDIHLRLKINVSSSIRSRLRSRFLNKNHKSTFSFLPYTIDDLMKHLESLFKPEMTWQNYGQWHIDHIKPDCLFNYKSVEDEEFQKCWALKNLQPLWAQENFIKNKRYEVIINV